MSTPSTRKTSRQAPKSAANKILLAGLALVLLILIGFIGAWAGYQHGAVLAANEVIAPNAEALDEQYQLGLEDYQVGRYESARQRLEYVVAFAPEDYPDAWEYLSEILQILNTTATPTLTQFPPTLAPSPTITLTPTRDPSGVESIFQRAQSLLAAGDWDGAVAALIALRNEDLTYRVVEVDDSLFAALRNRGEQRILQLGDLEGGLYDLSLAEKIGPLDYQATVYRGWARLYLTGLGFWQAYPEQAVYYFGQVAASVPGLRDGTGSSAGWRYRMSLLHYGAELAAERRWCEAQQQYELALQFGGADEELPLTLTHVANICSPPTQTMTLMPSITLTNTVTLTPLPGPSATVSGMPTATTVAPTLTTVPPPTLTTVPPPTLTTVPPPTLTTVPPPTLTTVPPPTLTTAPPPTLTTIPPPTLTTVPPPSATP